MHVSLRVISNRLCISPILFLKKAGREDAIIGGFVFFLCDIDFIPGSEIEAIA